MSLARPLRSLVASTSRAALASPAATSSSSSSSCPTRRALLRSFSTTLTPRAEEPKTAGLQRRNAASALANRRLEDIFSGVHLSSAGAELEDPAAGERVQSRMLREEGPTPSRPGYEFGELPPREDPVLSLLTNLLMKHGKKEAARKIVREAMQEIHRTTHRPPLPLIHEAISLVSPSLRIISLRRSSKVVHVPAALTARQRARQAVMWILKAAEKGRGGGATRGRRIAREVLGVMDGTSGAVAKLGEVHKQGAANRSNLKGPR